MQKRYFGAESKKRDDQLVCEIFSFFFPFFFYLPSIFRDISGFRQISMKTEQSIRTTLQVRENKKHSRTTRVQHVFLKLNSQSKWPIHKVL